MSLMGTLSFPTHNLLLSALSFWWKTLYLPFKIKENHRNKLQKGIVNMPMSLIET